MCRMKPSLVVAFLFAVSAAHAQSGRPLNLTVHTTSGCTDTVWWIQTQLIPVFNEFHQYLDPQFVPWGRTQRAADGSHTCQFGSADCWANRLHRCSLHLLKWNPNARMTYMNCEFRGFTDRPAFQFASRECAYEAGILPKDIDVCMGTSLADELADAAQAQSVGPMATINFVPAIVINDDVHQLIHSMAFQDLRSIVCALLSQDPTTGVNC